jgi:hypothetical protein
LAAKPKNSEDLSQATKDRLLADLKKYTIAGIQPEFVDINVLYVELDSTVYYNSNFIGSASDLKAQITQSLETYSRSSDLNKFGGRFKYSKALRLIDVTNTAITSNITKVRIRRNVGVLIDQPTQYLICFENRFAAHSEAKLKNIRTTGFTLRGFNSICYVGDKPNSNLETGILYVFTLDGEKELVISENIGTIDYIAGEINIDNIEVTSTVLPNNIIEIEATPYSNDIIAKKSIYLELDVGKSDISVVRDIISSGENTSGSRFTPESSFITETNIRS